MTGTTTSTARKCFISPTLPWVFGLIAGVSSSSSPEWLTGTEIRHAPVPGARATRVPQCYAEPGGPVLGQARASMAAVPAEFRGTQPGRRDPPLPGLERDIGRPAGRCVFHSAL